MTARFVELKQLAHQLRTAEPLGALAPGQEKLFPSGLPSTTSASRAAGLAVPPTFAGIVPHASPWAHSTDAATNRHAAGKRSARLLAVLLILAYD